MQEKNSKGHFTKGSSPWNKNKKGIHLSPETEFKPGQHVGESHPSWKGGIQTMKNDCKYKHTGNGKRVRLPRALYEETHGKIPNGYVILHIDGDKHNDDISNLKAVTKGDLMRINAKSILVSDLDY